MNYKSTRGSKKFNFKDILFSGLAEDGGLFVPIDWPQVNLREIERNITYPELATNIIKPFVHDEISTKDLDNLVENAYSNQFSKGEIISFKNLNTNEVIVELFNGPTLAFKDFAMQLLVPIFDYFLDIEKKKLNLIVATSGDTGSAAIDAVRKSKNINIFCLFPKGRISEFQRRQMSTVTEKNIFLCEIDGTFDDCQKIVKEILKDYKFSVQNKISAVNSINWARIIIQSVYYFYTYIKFNNNNDNKVNFSVPTGNFGDIYAGYVAYKMGLPVNRLIIATNENDILDRFMKSGIYKTDTVVKTTSPSMDIQIASNFERLLYEVFDKSEKLTASEMLKFEVNKTLKINIDNSNDTLSVFSSCKTTMDEIEEIIKNIYHSFGYVLDPHTATGLNASRNHNDSQHLNFVLSTANPIKFSDTVEKCLGNKLDLLSNFSNLFTLDERIYKVDNNIQSIKNFIKINKLQ